MERQRAIYQFIIYRAEDLPRTNLGLFASVKKAIGGTPEAFIDAMVKIHFAGQVVRTQSTLSPRPIAPPIPPNRVTSSAVVCCSTRRRRGSTTTRSGAR